MSPSSNNRKHILSSAKAEATIRKPFNFELWVSSKFDEFKASLFFSPLIAVVLAIGLGIGLTHLDAHLSQQGVHLPNAIASTVDSSRIVLSTIAGATITFAGTAFSVSLLVFQLGSSQYSPRIVTTLFRDPYNRRVMALTVGNYTYCLVVLRAVKKDTDTTDAQELVPTVSVAVAMALGIVCILAIVAFIDHSAHSIDISELLGTVVRDTITTIQNTWIMKEDMDHKTKRDHDQSDNNETKSTWEESPDDHVVRFVSSGWVQEINIRGMETLVPKGGLIKIHTIAGRYSLPGTAICSVSNLHQDQMSDEELQVFDQSVRDLIAVGRNRTMRADAAFGLRQIVDVTLRALSPGVNDPTTAQDGIFHSAAVVIEFLRREPPPSVMQTEDGGKLILEEQFSHDRIVRLAYDEVRICAASSPMVCTYLIESLRSIRESLTHMGLKDRAPEIERQVQLIEAGCLNASHVSDDHDYISEVRSVRFPDLLPLHASYKEALIEGK